MSNDRNAGDGPVRSGNDGEGRQVNRPDKANNPNGQRERDDATPDDSPQRRETTPVPNAR